MLQIQLEEEYKIKREKEIEILEAARKEVRLEADLLAKDAELMADELARVEAEAKSRLEIKEEEHKQETETLRVQLQAFQEIINQQKYDGDNATRKILELQSELDNSISEQGKLDGTIAFLNLQIQEERESSMLQIQLEEEYKIKREKETESLEAARKEVRLEADLLAKEKAAVNEFKVRAIEEARQKEAEVEEHTEVLRQEQVVVRLKAIKAETECLEQQAEQLKTARKEFEVESLLLSRQEAKKVEDLEKEVRRTGPIPEITILIDSSNAWTIFTTTVSP
jgi:hypothetical protein